MPTPVRYDEIHRVGLSKAQRVWLRKEAARRGLNVSAVIREMVQAAMLADQERQRKAAS